jgi:C1A family cysteine protease
MKFAAAFLALCAVAKASMTFKNDPFWLSFKSQYGKSYKDAEEARRYDIFQKNMARAAELNEIDPLATYGWTKYSDKDASELFRPLDLPAFLPRREITVSVKAPESFDWREKGAITPVKDQGQCGSCWAFCATCAMESAHFLKHQTLLSLSEQRIVDCDTYDHGCNGGWPTNAFQYIQENGGMELESDYPYTAYDGTCKFDASKAVMQVDDFFTFDAKNEEKFMAAMQQYGAIAVAVDASKFNSYQSGIMNGSGCSAYSLNHGVTAVGWGVESGTKYWIVKNSWGSDWGENGYVRMLKGANACGIENYPMGVTAK